MPGEQEEINIWKPEDVKASLPKRQSDSHKGSFGTGLLFAGSRDMPGAALLSGSGAMRSGIGKLVIGTDPEVILMAVPFLPEATYLRNGLKRVATDQNDWSQYRAIAIGPGIEPDGETEKAVFQLLMTGLPIVLDAGALSKRHYEKSDSPIILTPHPAEFSRISGISVKEVQENRTKHAKDFATEMGVSIVLKGKETIVAFPDGAIYKNPTGNSALAKGGTGDVLTGMLLGMLCCHENWKHAVLNAVHLHGACADRWTEKYSAHTLLAHELAGLLREVWKSFE